MRRRNRLAGPSIAIERARQRDVLDDRNSVDSPRARGPRAAASARRARAPRERERAAADTPSATATCVGFTTTNAASLTRAKPPRSKARCSDRRRALATRDHPLLPSLRVCALRSSCAAFAATTCALRRTPPTKRLARPHRPRRLRVAHADHTSSTVCERSGERIIAAAAAVSAGVIASAALRNANAARSEWLDRLARKNSLACPLSGSAARSSRVIGTSARPRFEQRWRSSPAIDAAPIGTSATVSTSALDAVGANDCERTIASAATDPKRIATRDNRQTPPLQRKRLPQARSRAQRCLRASPLRCGAASLRTVFSAPSLTSPCREFRARRRHAAGGTAARRSRSRSARRRTRAERRA